MDISTKINIALCILSFILAVISVITVVVTLRQNHKMIENATRPYLCVYGEEINPGSPQFYLIVKNFGNSPAITTKFECSCDLSKCYGATSKHRNFLDDLSKSVFAPGQSKICRLDYGKVPDEICFHLEYFFGKKKYSEEYVISVKAGSAMPVGKVDDKGKELRTISYTLQEMLQKSL